MTLPFVLLADRRLEGFLVFSAPGLAGAFDTVALHGG
jgi:hypothetical protein